MHLGPLQDLKTDDLEGSSSLLKVGSLIDARP